MNEIGLVGAKVVVILDDTGEALDISLVNIPLKFKELFMGAHFADIKELNAEVFSAARCAKPQMLFGSTPLERREFVERMQRRKA